MPTHEQRIAALGKAIRLQNRECAVQRALYVSSQQDVHDRLEGIETRFDLLEAMIDARFATLEADNRAILNILREQYGKPGA